MRVTIEHREVTGLTGKKQYFVDCELQLTEEEKAIIRARTLGDNFITVGSDIPTGSGVDAFGFTSWGLQIATRLLALGGFITVITGIMNITGETLPLLLWILAAAVFAYRKYSEKQNSKSYGDQQIKLRALLTNSRFAIDGPGSRSVYRRRPEK